MQIDLTATDLISFSALARKIPGRGKRPIALSSVHRWRTRGLAGIKLPARLIGGRWFTTLGAFEQFNAKVELAKSKALPITVAKIESSESSQRPFIWQGNSR